MRYLSWSLCDLSLLQSDPSHGHLVISLAKFRWVQCTAEHSVFCSSLLLVYIKEKTTPTFCKKYPTPAMPCNKIYRTVDKVSVAGSVLRQMKLHKCHALTEEKLDNSNILMKTSPSKNICAWWVIKVESKASAHSATKLLKIMAILHPPECEGRSQYCRQFQESPMDFLIHNVCYSCIRHG